MDLFLKEQQIYDTAIKRALDVHNGAPFDIEEYAILANEYGWLLKQFRKLMRFSDRTTMDLFKSNMDLTGKVHYDTLCGIYNRRFMEENLERLMRLLSRSNGVLSVMMVDIDFFKKYNDTYGHGAGDVCLKSIAETLAKCITREDDFVARYGGEEFLVVLPHTDEHGAHVTASRLLESIIERNIPHEKSDVADCVTVSIGVTTVKVAHTHKTGYYIKRADDALYMSKHNGRNRYTYLKYEEDRE
uniref:Putative sensory box/GGDEF family protein n=1 Tax=uncultured bacterium contig00014 TaxID=1181505 RepID=A0A806KFB4_9BACT|nr:putative sensory box/GGDEF family protein [uncultured bacterium contig00014]